MTEDKKILISLKKAQSHLGNVIKMLEDKKYCVDILQQNLAVMGLLKAANNQILARHLRSCFATALSGKDKKKKERMIEEVVQINKIIN